MARKHADIEAPHFFKVILEDALREGKLRMPKKFVRKYGKLLSNSAFLRTPSSSVWKIHLTKRNDQIWFDQGWPEFAGFYSLKPGHFIVFRHEGNSSFSVLILDVSSATEIEYPFHTSNGDETEQMSPSSHSWPHKKMKLTPSRCTSSISKEQMKKGSKSESQLRSKCLTADEKAEVFSRANNFKSENPFCVTALQPSHISGRTPRMSLPTNFAKMNFLERQHDGNTDLCSSDGRIWPVEYRKYGNVNSSRYYLCRGWKKFADDNNLQVGDGCVFELLRSPNLSLKVSIFRS